MRVATGLQAAAHIHGLLQPPSMCVAARAHLIMVLVRLYVSEPVLLALEQVPPTAAASSQTAWCRAWQTAATRGGAATAAAAAPTAAARASRTSTWAASAKST